MPALPATRLSPEEYLVQERRADRKSEYLDGEVFAMAGASRSHNLVVVNATAALHGRLRDRGCEIYSSDMRVHVPATGLFAYPDLAVVCEPPRFHDERFDTLLNPTLIIEVLSEQTKDYDRGTKFLNYRSIGTLVEYLLLDQDRLHGELYRRQRDQWSLTTTDDLQGLLDLRSVGAALPLSEVYEGVPIDRLYSQEAERAVLAAILLAPEQLLEVAARLAPEDFHLSSHRAVFAAMGRLSEEGVRVDVRSLTEALSREEPPAGGGWLTFLGSLDLDLPDLGRMDAYMEIVEQWSRERRRRSLGGARPE